MRAFREFKFLIGSLLVPFSCALVYGGFEDVGFGARAPGMAESFVAVADDGAACFYNPAGLTQIPRAGFSADYNEVLKGLSDGSRLDAASLAYNRSLYGGNAGHLAVSYQSFKAAGYYDDRSVAVGYAYQLRRAPFGADGAWSFGVNVKQLHREINSNGYFQNAVNDNGLATGRPDPLIQDRGLSENNIGFDVGALVRAGTPDRLVRYGASITNVNKTSLAARVARFGASISPGKTLLSAEFRRAQRLTSASDKDWSVGAERRIPLARSTHIIARGGYGRGSRGWQSLTAGVSFEFAECRLDYAFIAPFGNELDAQGAHRIGLTISSFRATSPR